jgi:hypothetical protein
MLIKFFKYGEGDGTSAFNYLLNHREQEGTASVLRGSKDFTLSTIKSLTSKKRYKAGCLSFEEENLSQTDKEEIMDLFEEVIFPGMNQEDRNVCWVEHTDKGRLELNFVIPRVFLKTGKAFNPYYHKKDRQRFSAFRDYINLKYGLSNPMDATKQQVLKLSTFLEYNKKQKIEKLNEYLVGLIESNVIHHREGVIQELKALGFEITRQGSDYLSIKEPNGAKAIKLKGKYYHSDWTIKEKEEIPLKHSFNLLKEQIKLAADYVKQHFYKEEMSDRPTKIAERHINAKAQRP